MISYEKFIEKRHRFAHGDGFEVENLPSFLFPFQEYLVRWALQKGRAAIFSDCGTGKTAMQLAFANECIRRENKPALICTPLAVGAQVLLESEKFGIEASRSRDGKCDGAKIWITN